MDFLRRVRWPDGFRCPACGRSLAWMTARGQLRCVGCQRQTSPTAGTIFEGTRKPLRLWFQAMWYVTNQKHGVSALGVQRILGLGSYQTAWTWLHKLRRAMVRPGRDLLSGEVEVDETYLGGREVGVTGRKTNKKSIVAIAGCRNPRNGRRACRRSRRNPSRQSRPASERVPAEILRLVTWQRISFSGRISSSHGASGRGSRTRSCQGRIGRTTTPAP